MMTSNTKRERIRDKIRALLSKTTDRGCTEAEAMAAAQMAAKLMQDYGLCRDDLDYEEARSKAKGKGQAYRSRVWSVIAYCTNTTSIVHETLRGCDVGFFGQAPGPEIADYLRRVCDRAIDREVAAFKETAWYKRRRTLATKRQAVADFTEALVLRINSRLVDTFTLTINDQTREASRKALQNQRSDLVTSKPRAGKKTRYSVAAGKGWSAGGNVSLSHGVNGTGKVAALEGGTS